METRGIEPRAISVIRWIARGWSLLVFGFVLLRIFTPDPYATEPVPLEDWFLLSLWGTAVLGLLVAWRWELAGGIFTIAVMFLRELAWIVLKGAWLVNFLIVWLLIVPPAVLFLIAWRLDRNVHKASV